MEAEEDRETKMGPPTETAELVAAEEVAEEEEGEHVRERLAVLRDPPPIGMSRRVPP